MKYFCICNEDRPHMIIWCIRVKIFSFKKCIIWKISKSPMLKKCFLRLKKRWVRRFGRIGWVKTRSKIKEFSDKSYVNNAFLLIRTNLGHLKKHLTKQVKKNWRIYSYSYSKWEFKKKQFSWSKNRLSYNLNVIQFSRWLWRWYLVTRSCLGVFRTNSPPSLLNLLSEKFRRLKW